MRHARKEESVSNTTPCTWCEREEQTHDVTLPADGITTEQTTIATCHACAELLTDDERVQALAHKEA